MKSLVFKFINILAIILVISCARQKDQVELMKSGNRDIEIIVREKNYKDSLTCFLICPPGKYKFVRAYYGCGYKDSRVFNLLDSSLVDCNSRLMIDNDTVIMCATYGEVGRLKFEDVTLILKDQNSEMSFIDTTFFFNIVDVNMNSVPE